MTRPSRDKVTGEHALTPAATPRSRRAAAAPDTSADYDEAELQRGLAAAVLGSLGRLQLRLDALAREQSDAFVGLKAQLADLDRRLAAIESLGDAGRHGADLQYAPRPFSTDTTVRASSTTSKPSDQSST